MKANHSHLLRTEAGLTISRCIPYNCAWIRPSATVSYVQKRVLQGQKFTCNFVKYKPIKLNVHGTTKTIDSIVPGIGLDIQTSNQMIYALNYDADLNRLQTIQRVSCRFQRAF